MGNLTQTKGRFLSGYANTWVTIDDDHSVKFTENLIVNASDEITVTLPAEPSPGQWLRLVVKSKFDVIVDAGALNITGHRASGTPIKTIESDNQSAMFVYDGTGWIYIPNITITEDEVSAIATGTAITYSIALG